MAKHIVYCADGTWNGPGTTDGDDKHAPTNVFKLFTHLAGHDSSDTLRLANEQERFLASPAGAIAQAAKYLHGVGDSDNVLFRILGGGFGAGIVTQIVRGYTFVSRNYVPGDKIVLVGFSRGAYTARSLAGLIGSRGLLDATRLDLSDKERAYRLGAAVWFDYRRAAMRARGTWFGHVQEVLADLPAFLWLEPTTNLVADVPIEAVAVWDTVGALGIPEFAADQRSVDAFQFCDTKLGDKVRRAFHAIAIDEARGNFTPTLWDPDPRIVQTLFPGAHADVGGGYAVANEESGLSDGALQWMLERLAEIEVSFTSDPLSAFAPLATATGHQPWTGFPWTHLPNATRTFRPEAKLLVHPSLCERLKAAAVVAAPGLAPAPYAPTNIDSYRALCG